MNNKDKKVTGKSVEKGPLVGVTVVEMSAVVFGPYGGQILADLGAEVIKVESESGDIMRYPGNSPAEGMGPIFMALNRNKRSIQLNLSETPAKQAMMALLASADVFYTNVRMQGLIGLGLSYDEVKEINPNILYVHCSGFGSNGPYAGQAAYDDLVQAASGFADLIPRSEGDAQPRYMPSLVADKTAGLHAAYATLAGLFHLARTGEGQFVEVPMFEAFTSFNMIENLYEQSYQPSLGQVAYKRSVDANRKPYRTRDGFIAIVPYSSQDWRSILGLLGQPEVMDDPRFSSYEARTENISELYALLHRLTPNRTTEQWTKDLTRLEIPHAPVTRLDEVKNDPHLQATNFFELREQNNVGQYYSVGHPVKFSKTPASLRSDPPVLGQDGDEILARLGYSKKEIKQIVASNSKDDSMSKR